MTNLSIVGQEEVSENQVLRSNVAKTQQPDAKGLSFKIFPNIFILILVAILRDARTISTLRTTRAGTKICSLESRVEKNQKSRKYFRHDLRNFKPYFHFHIDVSQTLHRQEKLSFLQIISLSCA